MFIEPSLTRAVFEEVKATPEAIEKMMRLNSKDVNNSFYIVLNSSITEDEEHGFDCQAIKE